MVIYKIKISKLSWKHTNNIFLKNQNEMEGDIKGKISRTETIKIKQIKKVMEAQKLP